MSKTYLLPKILLLITIFSFPFVSKSQINLVKDINTFTAGSDPKGFINITLNGTIYFIANDGPHGLELWKTDGTGATTSLVKDINPGIGSGMPFGQQLFVFNGAIYFFASNGTDTSLWRTDGTQAGTIELKVTKPYSISYLGVYSGWFTVLNNSLYFIASDAANGFELWKTDGTVAGTVLVKDIYPGATGSMPSNLYVYNGNVYFTATNNTSGKEIWKTDGTTAGTVMIKDIIPGIEGSQPSGFNNYNGILYFTATDGTSGIELWRTDGTAGGTTLVKDIILGLGSANPQYFFQFTSSLFFYITRSTSVKELWKTDGSAGGTVFVQTIDISLNYSGPYIINNNFYFTASDNTNGNELWKSDGTTAGTALLKDINPGYENSYATHFTILNGLLLFTAIDPTNGIELWKTDGTAAGTIVVKDIYPGAYWDYNPPIPVLIPYDALPTNLVNYNGSVYFTAQDGVHGNELWKTDGTEAGTLLVQDIIPGSSGSIPFTYYSANIMKVVDGQLYFQANNGFDGIEPWKSDGTATGAAMIKNIHIFTGGSSPANLTAVNEKVYFNANYGLTGNELWISDGTDAGTYLVKDINPGTGSSALNNFTKFNNKLIFSANDGVHNIEPWISDGTGPGTFMLKDIFPGNASSQYGSFYAAGNIVYFAANDGLNGIELWKTDGTAAGTVLFKDINTVTSNSSSSPGNIITSGGIIYFSATDGINGSELWKTDGTAAGTVMIKDIRPGSTGSAINSMIDINGTLFFIANDDGLGAQLWKSDGTTAGTVMVKDLGYSSFNITGSMVNANGTIFFATPNALWKSDGTTAGTVQQTSNGGNVPTDAYTKLCNVNGVVFFDARDGAHHTELWKSDGTNAGTFMVKDIYEGPDYGSYPSGLIEINGLAYFAAYDSAHGRELWRSDGTTAGTVLIQDKYPGINHFYYGPMAKTSSKLFINGTHFTTGSELYAMCINPTGPCLSNSSVTKFIEEGNDFMANACEVIARVKPTGSSFVTGLTTAKVWIEPFVPAVNGVPYVARHYEITPDYNSIGSTGRVTLYFTQQEFTDFNNHPSSALNLPANPTDVTGKDNLRITKYPGVSNNGSGFPNSYTGTPVIINPADSNIVWNVADSRWEVSFDVTGFSGFFIHTSGVALPVKLVFFKGKLNTDKTVALQWKVEEQTGITNYVIERSSDGSNFLAIGSVTANQQTSYTYQFTDLQVLNGKAFYRLRVNETAGNHKYSDIVFLSTKDNTVLTVFPNPATDMITVQLNSDQQKATIKILDEQGRLLLSEIMITNRINNIDISRFATGYYILQVIDGDRVTRRSFFKR